MHGLTADETTSVRMVSLVCALFSIAASLCTILLYRRHKDLQTFAFRLVYFTAICDLGSAIAAILGVLYMATDSSALCFLEAVLSHFFNISSSLWTVAISYTLHTVLLQGSEDADRLGPLFHRSVWGVTSIATLLPALTNSYGESEGMCWIDNSVAGTIWRFLAFYLILVAGSVFVIWVAIRVQRQVNVWEGHPRLEDDSAQQSVDARLSSLRRMRLYPLALVVTWFFALVSRLSQLAADPVFGLVVLHVAFSSLLGVFNAAVYAMTPQVRAKLRWGSHQPLDETA